MDPPVTTKTPFRLKDTAASVATRAVAIVRGTIARAEAARATVPAVRTNYGAPAASMPGTLPQAEAGVGGAGLYIFFAAVILPTIAAALYFFLLASHEYEVETRFVVRSAQEQKDVLGDAMSTLSKLGVGGGSSRSTFQDGAIVLDYIKSRPILDDLGGRSVITDIYRKGNIFSRLGRDPTLEDLWRYWNSKVSGNVDTPSGIVTVKVRSFVPEDGVRLANAILQRSEALVNEISERSRVDAMQFAEGEMGTANDRLSKARRALLEFRNANAQIDPGSVASSTGDLMAALLLQRIDLENKITVGKSDLAADSPTQRLLRAQVAAIDDQLTSLQTKLTGQSNDNAASKLLAQYDDLQLSVKFAERLLTTAQSAYEKARIQAARQQLYLVPVVRPSLPDKAQYPHATFDTFLTFLSALMIWGVLVLIAAAVRDHLE